MTRIKIFILAVGLAATLASVRAQASSRNGAAKKAPANVASAEEIARGREVYRRRCAVCHYAGSEAKKVAVGLKGLSKRGKYADGKPVTDESLREWIERGGKNMPGYKAVLNAEQVRDLIAYLKTL